MVTTMLACAGCWNPIGVGAQPVRLCDLQFHEVCAPYCRACRTRLTAEAEDRWSYHGTVISSRSGYMTQPTEFWCDSCRELHERDSTFAQD